MRYFISCCIFLISFASFAELGLTGTPLRSNSVSGNTTSSSFSLNTPGYVDSVIEAPMDTALRGIKWYEYSDKPCAVFLRASTLNKADDGELHSTYDYDSICGDSGGNSSNKDVTYEEKSRKYVHGVSVCLTRRTNPDTNRIKGIRIHGVQILEDGTFNVLGSGDDVEGSFFNCLGNWQQPSRCRADNEVVTRVHFYHKDGYLTGLQVECRRVRHQ